MVKLTHEEKIGKFAKIAVTLSIMFHKIAKIENESIANGSLAFANMMTSIAKLAFSEDADGVAEEVLRLVIRSDIEEEFGSSNATEENVDKVKKILNKEVEEFLEKETNLDNSINKLKKDAGLN